MTPQANIQGSASFPTFTPIKAVLPTKQYPHLLKLVREIDYLCANCSSAEGRPVYRTLAESSANLQPISGPMGRTKSGKLRPMTTRFGVLCPVCRTMPEDTDMPGFSKGIVDLLRFSPDYKRPLRPKTVTAQALITEDEDDADDVEYTTRREQKAPRIGSRRKGPIKKKSELKSSSTSTARPSA